MSRGLWRTGPIFASTCLLWGLAAQADWLVLRDGARLETKGAWKVSGKQVVFSAPDGKLSSIRADQVELEASARATEEALRAEEPKADVAPVEVARPKARWSFSDKDFARPTPAEEESDGSGSEGEQGGQAAPPPAPKSDLEVLVWSHSVDPSRNRIKVSGTLQNGGKAMAASIALQIQLVDRQGVVVGERAATVQKSSLAPGESTDFATSFSEVVNYETVKFSPTASMLKIDPRDDKEKPGVTPP